MAGIDLLQATRAAEQAAVDLVAVVAGILGDVADLRGRHEPATGGKLPGREQIGTTTGAVAVVPAVAVVARIGAARLLGSRSPIPRTAPLTPARHRLAHRRPEEPRLRSTVPTGPGECRTPRAHGRKGDDGEHREGASQAPPGGGMRIHGSPYRPAEPSPSAHSRHSARSAQTAGSPGNLEEPGGFRPLVRPVVTAPAPASAGRRGHARRAEGSGGHSRPTTNPRA